MKSKKAAARLLVVALVALPLVAGLLPGERFGSSHVIAQASRGTPRPASKISPDLLNQSSFSKGDNQPVRVIVQTEGIPKSGLLSALNKMGGRVEKIYDRVGSLALNIPLRFLNALAAQGDVKYISPDRPAQMMGHLEATTGANLVRNYIG
ncbi:MAG TPA: hypothetical protein VID27_13075, partial [Blastocatellia bacterium]